MEFNFKGVKTNKRDVRINKNKKKTRRTNKNKYDLINPTLQDSELILIRMFWPPRRIIYNNPDWEAFMKQ